MIQNFTEFEKYKIQSAKLNFMHEVSISDINSTLDKHMQSYDSRRHLTDAITTELSVLLYYNFI